MNSVRPHATPRGARPDWRQRLGHYARLARLHRPIGILLLLWPMLWALWIAAAGVPKLDVLIIFVLGTVVMRSAGCVINDYADRNFDGHVERTKDRPLPAGVVTPREALLVFAVLLTIALGLVLATNRITILMAFGGAALPMAWLLFSTAVLWAVIYDTQYAMVDREDDLRLGIRSTAILFAHADRTIIAGLQCLMLSNLYLIGRRAELGWPYDGALLVAAALFIYQQYLIRDRSRAGCFAAFLNNNWVGGVVFAGVLLSYPPVSLWFN
jgi:4-hydroxybenzoate polyprenyltransferase